MRRSERLRGGKDGDREGRETEGRESEREIFSFTGNVFHSLFPWLKVRISNQ